MYVVLLSSSHEDSMLVAARPLLDNVISSISKPSISAGLGLVYKLDPVRVEVNFGVPLAASTSVQWNSWSTSATGPNVAKYTGAAAKNAAYGRIFGGALVAGLWLL